MGDPEMISRAERAAAALERAWERWRIMHGLSAEPTPPVSSYVGYSIEEPWGRPRVVFGVDAKEAELLAALLDRHAGVGAVYPPPRPETGPDLIHQGQARVPDGQVLLHDGPGQDQEDPSLFYDGQEFRYGACGPADDQDLLYDAYGLADGDQGLLHESDGPLYDGAGATYADQGLVHEGDGGALRDDRGTLPGGRVVGEGSHGAEYRPGLSDRETRAHIPAQAPHAEEGAGPDQAQRGQVAPRLPGQPRQAAESADHDGEDGDGSHDCRDGDGFSGKTNQDHPDEESAHPGAIGVGLNAAGPQPQHGADERPSAAPEQDAAGRAARARAKPGDRDAVPAATDSADSARPADKDSPAAAGEFAAGHDGGAGSDGSAEPPHTDSAESAASADRHSPAVVAGHEAGLAGGAVKRADREIADVADGLLHATDGCDPAFAGRGRAAQASGRGHAGPEAGASQAGPETGASQAPPNLSAPDDSLPAGPAAGNLSEPAAPIHAGLAGLDVGEPRADHTATAAAHPVAASAPGGARTDATEAPEGSLSAPPDDLGTPVAEHHGDVGIAAELAGWAAGELPGQASARLAEWVAMGRAPRQEAKTAGKPDVSTAARRR